MRLCTELKTYHVKEKMQWKTEYTFQREFSKIWCPRQTFRELRVQKRNLKMYFPSTVLVDCGQIFLVNCAILRRLFLVSNDHLNEMNGRMRSATRQWQWNTKRMKKEREVLFRSKNWKQEIRGLVRKSIFAEAEMMLKII